MIDGVDPSLQNFKRKSAVRVSQLQKGKSKRHILSRKITTATKDQMQHESNLKQLIPTFHRLVKFTPFNSVLNHIISYMLSPSIGTVMHLPHYLNNPHPYGILCRESKQASEPMIRILNTIEYYLSDAYVASNYAFQKLFNIKSSYDEEKDMDQYSEVSWDNIIQTLSTTLKKWNQEDSMTYTNIYDDIVESLNDVLKVEDWDKILFHNHFFNQNSMFLNNTKVHSETICHIKGKNISFYANSFLWLPINVFLRLPEFKKMGTCCEDIVKACHYSKTLKVGRFPPSDSHRCAESILGFISSINWDRSVLGRHNCHVIMPQKLLDSKIASKAISHQSTPVSTENEIDQCEDDPISLKTAIERLLNFLNTSTRDNRVVPVDNTIGEWYIGRPWPTSHYFKVLQNQLNKRILFIDNLPLECSPTIIECFFKKQKIPVKHVSMPRFRDSKKNKGFAFVECSCHSHVQQGIQMLHGTAARTLYTTGNETLCKFIPRNSRPLFCCSHTEWLMLKEKRKNLDSLGCFRENKTKLSSLEKQVSFNWVAIEPIECSVSPLELMQYIQHSVPLNVYYPPHSMKALVELSSEQDAHYLCFDILVCRRSLGGSYTTTARITKKPLELCELNA